MATNLEFRIPSLLENKINELDKYFDQFKSELFSLGLNQRQSDAIVKLTNNLLAENRSIIDYLLKNTVTPPRKIVEHVFDYNKKTLEAIDSQFKRYKELIFIMATIMLQSLIFNIRIFVFKGEKDVIFCEVC